MIQDIIESLNKGEEIVIRKVHSEFIEAEVMLHHTTSGVKTIHEFSKGQLERFMNVKKRTASSKLLIMKLRDDNCEHVKKYFNDVGSRKSDR